MKRRLRLGALVALIAVAATGSATRAQDVPQVISPLRVEADHNGVNLVSGRTTIDLPILSVPAAPNLRFDRVQNAAPYVRGEVTGAPGEFTVGNWSVHTGGGASESFTCIDFQDCTSVTGTGSTFRGPPGGGAHAVYRQAGSGATWHFTETSSGGFGNVRQSYARDVVYPNGETITYSYQTAYLPDYPTRPYYRPVTITSNLGYFITVTYHPGELGTQGWNQASSATLYASAEFEPQAGRFVLHWFSAKPAIVKRAANLGCWFSIGATMLASKTGRAAIDAMPADRIVPETDGPFGSIAGRPAFPWETMATYRALAAVRGAPVEQIERELTDNFRALVDATSASGPVSNSNDA